MSETGVRPTQAAITELKVTGHLMTLEPGVFCVFNTPGSAGPDGATGLPGVRISAAPAPGPHQGEATISGFNGDGWLGGIDGAVLIRVADGSAQVLVTVYQAANTKQDAPKLQVIRLTEGAAPPKPAAVAAPVAPPALAPASAGPMEVAAHVYGRGDVGARLGDWVGERGSKRWIEGFGLSPIDGIPASDLEYQAVLGRGWLSPWMEGGQFCGSRGMSLPILGLRVRLRGTSAETHAISLSATFVDGSATGPVGAGEPCEAPSLAALEAFQVVVRPQPSAEPAPRRGKPARAAKAAPPPPPPVKPISKRAAPKPVVSSKPISPSPAKAPAAPKAPAKRTPATTRRR